MKYFNNRNPIFLTASTRAQGWRNFDTKGQGVAKSAQRMAKFLKYDSAHDFLPPPEESKSIGITFFVFLDQLLFI